jgi:hypothetical protein
VGGGCGSGCGGRAALLTTDVSVLLRKHVRSWWLWVVVVVVVVVVDEVAVAVVVVAEAALPTTDVSDHSCAASWQLLGSF